MTSVALIGYGKMGKFIHSLDKQLDFSVEYILTKNETWDLDKINRCDVAIEFTQPDSAFENISKCIELGIPVVSGTTGWLDRIDEIKELLTQFPKSAFLYGSNFSLGVNLFFLINQYCAQIIPDEFMYPTIKEVHHTEKKDAPSGTAISLANDVIEQRETLDNWVLNEKADKQLTIQSIREPHVPGTHIIRYEGEEDIIELEHKALSRKGFAVGAVKASKWLVGKHGFFTVQDYIKDTVNL